MSLPHVATAPVVETETGHVTELLYDDGGNEGLLACAAHGGRIEPGTAEQALALATRLGGSCWACLGYDEGNEFEEFHETSTAVDPDDYRLLGRIADRGFETVVSFHGLADPGVLIGGGIDGGVKERVAKRLDRRLSADARAVAEGQYAGTSPENFVNWLAVGDGGIQVEQGPPTRNDETDAVVAALAAAIRAGEL